MLCISCPLFIQFTFWGLFVLELVFMPTHCFVCDYLHYLIYFCLINMLNLIRLTFPYLHLTLKT